MQILVETGVIGLVLFLAFLTMLLRLNGSRDEVILISTIVVIYLVGFVGEPLFFSRKPYLLFNLFIALFMWKVYSKEKG